MNSILETDEGRLLTLGITIGIASELEKFYINTKEIAPDMTNLRLLKHFRDSYNGLQNGVNVDVCEIDPQFSGGNRFPYKLCVMPNFYI